MDPEAPVPRLHSVTETGLVRIVWDRKLIVPVDIDQIPKTKYVLVDESLRIRVQELEELDAESQKR